jgi:hypothetical protein
MRFACAEIRFLFLQAAAEKFHVTTAELKIEDGIIRTLNSSQKASYWELLSLVNLDVDANGRAFPKNFRSYHQIGKSLTRKDLLGKLTGAAFLHDISMSGMVHGRIVRPPSTSAKLISLDSSLIYPCRVY